MTCLPTVILGAAVLSDGPSPALLRRARRGAQLWHEGSVSRIICCGAMGRHPPSEAEAIARVLRDQGVPDAAMVIEDRSLNTAENLRYALGLLPPDTRELRIVTDWYHIPRARLIARRLGVRPQMVGAGLKGARALPQLRSAARELPAYIAYLCGWRGRF